MQRKHHLILYALLALCLVLAVAWAAQAESEKNRLARALEEGYAGALEDAMARMRQLRGNIDKALVSADAGQSALLIARIGSDAAAAQGLISTLPLSHPAMGEAVKLCCQAGDYALALLPGAGESLTEEQARRLTELSAACQSLLEGMEAAAGQMRAEKLAFGAEALMLADADGDARPLERAAQSITYPTLIYDGPFSDVVSEDAPRGLGEGTVSQEEAEAIAAAFTGADSAVCVQESGGDMPAYVVQAAGAGGDVTLAVTKQGGQVLWMAPEQGGWETKYGLEDCRRAAKGFLQSHGYGEMALTFWQMYGGLATLSYAAVQEGVLLYPDLVKVQLRLDTLDVGGIEARHYLASHTLRQGLTPGVTRQEAQKAVSGRLNVTAAQLCLIPLNRSEVLCWQFTGESEGRIYYVYIDAHTGRQREILQRVESDAGPRAE